MLLVEHGFGKETLENLNPGLSRARGFPFPFSGPHTCQAARATPGEHPTLVYGKKVRDLEGFVGFCKRLSGFVRVLRGF